MAALRDFAATITQMLSGGVRPPAVEIDIVHDMDLHGIYLPPTPVRHRPSGHAGY